MTQGSQLPLRQLPIFADLQRSQQRLSRTHLRNLFAEDLQRAEQFSRSAVGMFVDFSKQRIDATVFEQLLTLANDTGVLALRDALVRGEPINSTEHRAVLHPALRASGARSYRTDNADVLPEVRAVLQRMREYTDAVHDGSFRSASGEQITDVVSIGIGGSHLGSQMVVYALSNNTTARVRVHFVANVDGHELQAVLSRVDANRTLFIVASKTFTTQETMTNARAAREWLVARTSEAAVKQQFIAVSTAEEHVEAFGIDASRMFPFWDWVGGRYSVWSAIGLPVMLAVGADAFTSFLRGAEAMDEHFFTAEPSENIPLILGLLSVWNLTFWDVYSEAIIPYDARLTYLPAYLQQLVMESNGKRVQNDGSVVSTPTSGVVWGAAGTDAQHSFFQLLHQGTHTIPVEFLGFLQPDHDFPHQHDILLANMVAQSEALLNGRSTNETAAMLQQTGEPTTLTHAMTFPGNKPSTTILLKQLTPYALGSVLAMYEHRTFVAGAVWGINSFDQMGVELGKQLASTVLDEFAAKEIGTHDSSTVGLMKRILNQDL